MNVEKLNSIKEEIGEAVCLVAVSKTKPEADIQEAYDAGQRVFGENRPQELKAKAESLPKDIEWHMIGHLQSNKVKYIAPYVSLIHSVDKQSLLEEINKRAKNQNRVIDVLLQMHIAEEESKFGLNEASLKEIILSDATQSYENIRIVGMMGMATFTDDLDKVRSEFQYLKKVYEQTKSAYFANTEHFNILSMGMSGDYPIAIEEGSNMVRVGSLIFGARN